MNGFYRDRVDGFWTMDLDPRADVNVSIEHSFPAPVDVELLTIVAEGGDVTASKVSVSESEIVLRVIGSGGLVPLKVIFGTRDPQEFDIVTLRFRARAS
ncbi:hypothetical protein BSL82_02345 [Tardibacter chloracetimidivorans]|uniref:Uncharacterized protein n=1 Tax=Tardibacter chloracetimidivorans TaxID=1921510 RepID=A0A1L3ZRN5_9SPHN|nr:hypothetical protein [Tardibacter chloracetimidivorans]API58287.1 hypothetical protein BSL82_02345 [Tardibacter chloracetimidivorans]